MKRAPQGVAVAALLMWGGAPRRAELFRTLGETGGMYIPLAPDAGNPSNLRRPDGSRPADFPPGIYAPRK